MVTREVPHFENVALLTFPNGAANSIENVEPGKGYFIKK